MDYKALEEELKKRLKFQYSWGRKQVDVFDKQTSFIYKVASFELLLSTIEIKFKNNAQYNDLKNYALNRWFNFWSAKAIETIFCEHTTVKSHPDSYNKFTDFFINEIPFDHKTTVFPKGFKKSVPYAIEHKHELIEWLYKNQSQQQRKHFKNRLFIVLVNFENENEHWKLKAEISWLKNIVSTYLSKFEPSELHSFYFENEIVKADIIWAIK
ncbi:MAG: hypothetical protein GQ540_04010 [Lutibacter sp.]|uniref:hypothetical protein n=1 Tax=Lutibacter sp. TaxID=1925666 RepID=UPI001A03BB35|nr:hypothetical protein [Lutibacter sp.]NOR27679.1 hypothetical protein [Lutibacter sp.]